MVFKRAKREAWVGGATACLRPRARVTGGRRGGASTAAGGVTSGSGRRGGEGEGTVCVLVPLPLLGAEEAADSSDAISMSEKKGEDGDGSMYRRRQIF